MRTGLSALVLGAAALSACGGAPNTEDATEAEAELASAVTFRGACYSTATASRLSSWGVWPHRSDQCRQSTRKTALGSATATGSWIFPDGNPSLRVSPPSIRGREMPPQPVDIRMRGATGTASGGVAGRWGFPGTGWEYSLSVGADGLARLRMTSSSTSTRFAQGACDYDNESLVCELSARGVSIPSVNDAPRMLGIRQVGQDACLTPGAGLWGETSWQSCGAPRARMLSFDADKNTLVASDGSGQMCAGRSVRNVLEDGIHMQPCGNYSAENFVWTGLLVAASNRCIGLAGGVSVPGTRAVLADCKHDAPDQQWKLLRFADGTAAPTSGRIRLASNDALCLAPSADGVHMELASCLDDVARIRMGSDGSFRGPSGKCLDVADGRVDSGAPVISWECYGGANQSWTIRGRLEREGSDSVCIGQGAWHAASRPTLQPCAVAPVLEMGRL